MRDLCCESASFTPEQWTSLYDFKRTRNLRVHPKRTNQIIRRVVDEMPDSAIKSALEKMITLNTGAK
jgi:hypothetical protein